MPSVSQSSAAGARGVRRVAARKATSHRRIRGRSNRPRAVAATLGELSFVSAPRACAPRKALG
jgi:hypothetical protein